MWSILQHDMIIEAWLTFFSFFSFFLFWGGIDNSGDKASTLTTKVADHHPHRAWGEERSGWDLNSHCAGLATRKATPLSDWGSPLILWFLCFVVDLILALFGGESYMLLMWLYWVLIVLRTDLVVQNYPKVQLCILYAILTRSSRFWGYSVGHGNIMQCH